MDDHYAILDISECATMDDVKRAYRRQAVILHPDKNPDNKELAHNKFIQMRISYEVLIDPASRKSFDAARAWNKRAVKETFTTEQKNEYQKAKDNYGETESEARHRVKKWFYENIDVFPRRKKNEYHIQNNNTALDNLLTQVRHRLGSKLRAFIVTFWPTIDNDTITYNIKIVLCPSQSGFKECQKEWVEQYYYGIFTRGSAEDLKFNTELVESWLKELLDSLTVSYKISKIFFGVVGDAVAPWRCQLYLTVALRVSAIDIFYQSTIIGLTDSGKKNIKEIAIQFDSISKMLDIKPKALIGDKVLRQKLARVAENICRVKRGKPIVHERAHSQIADIFRRIKKRFPDAVRDYSSEMIDNMTLDIFIPSTGVAIQYVKSEYYSRGGAFGDSIIMQAYISYLDLLRAICVRSNVRLVEWDARMEISNISIEGTLGIHEQPRLF